MFEPVNTKKKEGVFDSETQYRLIPKKNRLDTRPSACRFNWRAFEIRVEFPVQFDDSAIVVADKNIMDPALTGEFRECGVPRICTVSALPEDETRSLQISRMNENIEVTELASRNMSIGANCKCGTFQRQHIYFNVTKSSKYLK
jgi:hypothetical protein